MLKYAFLFLLLALVAGSLGLGAIAGTAAAVARILFATFIVLFIAALLAGGKATN
jgi:uncharacterized membrane protein YtjA (UPF0391 family)